MISTEIKIPLKVKYGEDYRRFTFVGDSFDQLQKEVKAIFHIEAETLIVVKYIDEEGDKITLSSDEELKYAVTLLASENFLLRLEVETSPKNVNALPLTPFLHSPFHPPMPPMLPMVAPPGPMGPPPPGHWKRYSRRYIAAMNRRQRQQRQKQVLRRHLRGMKQEWRQMKQELKNIKPLDAIFVKHVTCEDGTEYGPDVTLTKTWRFRNSGSLAWPEGTILLRVSRKNNVMNAPEYVDLPKVPVKPNEEVDISVQLKTPSKPGQYTSFFRLQQPTGQKFGQRVRCMFYVVSSSSDEEDSVVVPNADERFQKQLVQLEEMGFKRRRVLLRLLARHNGNVNLVVRDYIKRMNRISGMARPQQQQQ